MENLKGQNIDKFVEDNLKLFYWLVHKYNRGYLENDDEVIDYCLDGYLQACINYNDSKEMKFSAYLSSTIHHYVLNYYSRNIQYISKFNELQCLDDVVYENKKGKKVYGIEMVKYDDFDRFGTVENSLFLSTIFEYIENNFPDIELSIFKDYLKGDSQKDIGNKYGYSQVYIGRIVDKIRRALRKEFNHKFNF